jgi:serine/threonine-protein kinase
LFTALLLASSLVTSRAFAGASPEDAALADSLYAEGGKLMEAGRWSEACPKIEASWKLDPAIGSSLRLAYCWERVGRSASSWSMYHEAEAMARRAGDKRADEAAKRAKELEPLLSRLVLDVAPENQAAGTEIRRDGKVIDAAAWASGIPIDPGAHAIEASAPARLPWKTTITIEPKPGVTTLHVPMLAAAPPEDKGATGGPSPFWGTQRVAGVATGAAGILGLAVGSILGGVVVAKVGSLKSGGHCNADLSACDAAGLPLRQDARSLAHGSTAALVVGGAALAAGVVVFFTAPSASVAAAPKSGARVLVGPVAGAEMTGVLVRGGW